MKFATKSIRHYPPHLMRVATLPWVRGPHICIGGGLQLSSAGTALGN